MRNNIRVERAILRITQQQLAEMISVSRQTINAIEADKYVPSTVLALKIAKVCNKKVEEIFYLEDTD
jgi:Predicted transcriptional regulators